MQQRRFRAGFSMPEVILALAILLIVLFAMGSAFPAASRTMARAQERDIAADSAHRELEYWRAVRYPMIHQYLGGEQKITVNLKYPLPEALTNGAGTVLITRAGSDFGDSTEAQGEDTGRVRITVSISWKTPRGNPGSIKLTTIVADNVLEENANDENGDTYDDDEEDPDTDADHDSYDTDPEENDENLEKGIPMPNELPTRATSGNSGH